MKFLKGKEIAQHIRDALAATDACDLAVSYWGLNAPSTLKLGKMSGDVRVLCDARSGACNPVALQGLLDMGVKLKTRDRLHAKVYLTRACAIVGSANASANGLGEEGQEAGNIEAAVELKDPVELA